MFETLHAHPILSKRNPEVEIPVVVTDKVCILKNASNQSFGWLRRKIL